MLPRKSKRPTKLELVEEQSEAPVDEQSMERKRAAYRIDLRSYVDRRQFVDRRNTIRFEDDRRHYIRRTEDRAWRLS